MPPLADQGYQLIPNLLKTGALPALRAEADRVAEKAGTVCVRHLRSRSALFHELSTSPLLLDLLPAGMRPVRSILFDKSPASNWPVAWHQDLTIAVAERKTVPDYGPWSLKDEVPHVQPPLSLLECMITIRLHLDPTPATNGALKVLPGSHLHGRIPTEKVSAFAKSTPEVICACIPGDALLMSPLILNASSRATTPTHRRVLHFEYAATDSLHPQLRWHERNAAI